MAEYFSQLNYRASTELSLTVGPAFESQQA